LLSAIPQVGFYVRFSLLYTTNFVTLTKTELLTDITQKMNSHLPYCVYIDLEGGFCFEK